MKASIEDSLKKTDFVKNCKMNYIDIIDNMQDALKNGNRQYKRHIESLNGQMKLHHNKLFDLILK
jgi:ribosomal protein L44E